MNVGGFDTDQKGLKFMNDQSEDVYDAASQQNSVSQFSNSQRSHTNCLRLADEYDQRDVVLQPYDPSDNTLKLIDAS